MRARSIARGGLALLILAVSGCAENKVQLGYRLIPGHSAQYRWTIDARTAIESPTEQTAGRLQAVLDLRETVRRGPQGGLVLSVLLRPLKIVEDGHPGALPPPSTLEYEVGSRGQIRRILKADVGAGAVSSLELDALMSETRPPLSARPVAIGGQWPAPLKIKSQRSSIDFEGNGRLEGFDLQDQRKLARIQTSREGRITSRQTLQKAPVVLRGSSRSIGSSSLDIDRGLLYLSRFRSTSDFDVLLSNRPAAKLKVNMNSRLELIGSGPGRSAD